MNREEEEVAVGCDNQVGFEGKRGFLGLTGRDLGRMAEYA